MIIFCPKDGGPGQLICPGGGCQFFLSMGVDGSEKMRSTPRFPRGFFFLEQPLAKLVCTFFGKPNFYSVDDARHFMLKVKCDGKSVNRP